MTRRWPSEGDHVAVDVAAVPTDGGGPVAAPRAVEDGSVLHAGDEILHAAIVERRLTLPDDRELARHASEAIARHSRCDWRIDKPNPRANIDAVIALAMAVERAQFKLEPLVLHGWL